MKKSTPIKQSEINYDCLTNLRNRKRARSNDEKLSDSIRENRNKIEWKAEHDSEKEMYYKIVIVIEWIDESSSLVFCCCY